MKFKYIFPVTTSLVLTEHWPVSVGDLTFEWTTESGHATEISVTVPMCDQDELPKIIQSDDANSVLEVHFGGQPHSDKVDEAIRTLQGLLHLFSSITIHTERYEVKWVPESTEDIERLKLYSYSKKTVVSNPDEPHPLSYDLVARVMSSLEAASDFDIPLSFLRRGNREIHALRYIEAFYNFFFFLETLYAPGFSDPKKVKKKLQENPQVINALNLARHSILQLDSNNKDKIELSRLLAFNDDELLGHFVHTRGSLHHHALKRPGIWHPDRPKEFRAEAIMLQRITHEISIAEMMEVIFSPEINTKIFKDAESNGSILKFRIDVVVDLAGSEQTATPVIYRIPGKRVTREIINHINSELHLKGPIKIEDAHLKGFKITSEDGTQIYGEYTLF